MFNKVVLVGNLGTDPKFTKTKGIAATFPLATSTRRNEDYDDPNVAVDWHRIVVPPRLLNECRNLKHDDVILVEGQLKTSARQKEKCEDGSRIYVYSTEVLAHTIKILLAKGSSD